MFIRLGYSAQTVSCRSATEPHHHAADMVAGWRDADAAERPQACARGLTLELGRAHPVEADEISLRGAMAVRSDALAHPLEGKSVAVLAHGGWLTCVQDTVYLPHVRRGRDDPVLQRERLEFLGDRHRHDTTGLQMGRRLG